MRDYLNGILLLIGAESLTDEEFGSVTVIDPTDDVGVYDTLLLILQAREVVSEMTSRLMYYFQAKGVAVSEPVNSRSNIFVGALL